MGRAAGVVGKDYGWRGWDWCCTKGEAKAKLSVVVLKLLALLSNEYFHSPSKTLEGQPDSSFQTTAVILTTFTWHTHIYYRCHGSSNLRVLCLREDIIEPEPCLLWLCVLCQRSQGLVILACNWLSFSLHLHTFSRECQTLPNHIRCADTRMPLPDPPQAGLSVSPRSHGVTAPNVESCSP